MKKVSLQIVLAWVWLEFWFINLQVLASKTKIYMILEYVTGGELFDRIVSKLMAYSFSVILFLT